MVVRELAPEKEYAFFKATQKAFYEQNKNTNLLSTYLELADAFDIDRQSFQTLFESSITKEKVKQDFSYAAQMGIRGFPSLVLKKGEEIYLVSNGYVKAKQITEAVKELQKGTY